MRLKMIQSTISLAIGNFKKEIRACADFFFKGTRDEQVQNQLTKLTF